MKLTRQILLLSILLFLSSCITQFIPHTTEDKQLLVVEGLITDQPGVNTIKLSSTVPPPPEILAISASLSFSVANNVI